MRALLLIVLTLPGIGCAILNPRPYAICKPDEEGGWTQLKHPPAGAAKMRAMMEDWEFALHEPPKGVWSTRADGRLRLCRNWVGENGLMWLFWDQCADFCSVDEEPMR